MDRKWEIEGHVGGTFNTDLSGTATALPAANVINPDGVGGTEMQYPTYFFGPSVPNINSILAGSFIAGTDTIVPFDPVLQNNVLQRDSSFAFGFRASRDIHPRFTVEASLDYNFGQLKMNSMATSAVAVTAASWGGPATDFINFFAPTLTGSAVGTGTFKNAGPAQLSYTGAVLFNFKTEGKFIPYIAVGGGGVSNLGQRPVIDLNGNLFMTDGTLIVNESDRVQVRFDIPATQGLFLFGGGFKYYFTNKWGIRLDVRDHVLLGNNYRTLVSANPGVTDTACGNSFFMHSGAPSNDIFWSCDQTAFPSNLNTTPFNKVQTFATDGVQHQIKVDFGVLLRF